MEGRERDRDREGKRQRRAFLFEDSFLSQPSELFIEGLLYAGSYEWPRDSLFFSGCPTGWWERWERGVRRAGNGVSARLEGVFWLPAESLPPYPQPSTAGPPGLLGLMPGLPPQAV